MIKNTRNFYSRMRRVFRRTLIRYSRDPRPASYPYISGDGFRKLAKHVYDETSAFNPKDISLGDIVFVSSAMFDKYSTDVHPRISNPYVLITHNGDKNIGSAETIFANDSKIIHWFAQNVLIKHPKITPIPIGLENAHYAVAGETCLYDKVRLADVEKNERILAAFNANTNLSLREPILSTLRKNPLVDIIDRISDQKSYLNLLKSYSFVASPPGNGEDCIRTWEALYMGTTPIVQNSAGMEYFRSLGLDLIIVESWTDIRLNEKRQKEKECPALFFDYWKQKITQAKNEAF